MKDETFEIPKEARGSALKTAEYCGNVHHKGIIPPYEFIISDVYKRFIVKGDNAIDVGVNNGFHYERLCNLVGDYGCVTGFEPVPDFIERVKTRMGPGMDLRNLALSDHTGESSFLYMTKAEGESGFKERTTEADRGTVEIMVKVSTIDIEMSHLESLKYIKLDTEGSEILVLEGGKEIINNNRPIISIEYGRPTYSLYDLTYLSLYEWSNKNEYIISDIFGNTIEESEEWRKVCDFSYWDYFIIPSEKKEYWKSLF